MNEGRKDGKQDPEQNRTAGHYQSDALQERGHVTEATEWNWNRQGNAGYTSQAKNAPSSSVRNVTGANVEVETRPKKCSGLLLYQGKLRKPGTTFVVYDFRFAICSVQERPDL